MISNSVDKFAEQYRFDNHKQEPNMPQSELMSLINAEFSKPFIKKLYYKLEWTDRIFWSVVGTIQLSNEELQLDRTISHMTRYLNEHKMPIPPTGDKYEF